MNPNFFVGIGAAKSGTSWLADYFARHPNIALSPIKELHYFDAMYLGGAFGRWNDKWSKILLELIGKQEESPSAELVEKIRCVKLRLKMVADASAYRDYFDELIDDCHCAFGEVTPAYSMLPEQGFQAILDLYPDAKFVFVMRDPVDRYLSQVQFAKKLLKNSGRARVDNFDPDLQAIKQLSNPAYIARGDYQRTIETLLKVTDSDNLCTLFYETIFDSEQSAVELTKLCNFLGTPFLPGDVNRKVNQGDQKMFSPTVIGKVREHLSGTYDFVFRRFGKDVPTRWFR